MGHLSNRQLRPANLKASPTERKIRNRLLLSLPPAELEIIHAFLEPCELPYHQVLHEPNEPLQYAVFPNNGLLSLVVATEDGGTVEVGMVGYEGLAGLGGAVGLIRAPIRHVVQIAGEGYRLKVQDLEHFLNSSPAFQLAICRYGVVVGMQMAQTAACNRLHDAGQRLTRWLLMARDRTGLNALPVTHDFLSTILGTDRPSVTLAAQTLQKKQIIDYCRGEVVIMNLRKLEAVSCECYRVIRGMNQFAGRGKE